MRLGYGIALGLILGSMLGNPVQAVEPDAPEQLITRADAVRILVQERLSKPPRKEGKYEKAEHEALSEFYADSDNKTIWVDENGLKPKARLVIKELQLAGNWGLNPNDYELPEEIILSANDTTPTDRLADFEYKLSHAVLSYVRHARGGRAAPQTIARNLDPTLELPEPLDVMDRLAVLDKPDTYIRDFHPKHPQFQALRQVLLRMRGGATVVDKQEGKKVTVPDGPALKPGMVHENVALLRQRLDVEVPVQGGVKLFPATVYDSSLEMAVKDFQRTQGLGVDGVVGPGTLRALNGKKRKRVAPRNREKVILANMERWRWIPGDLSKTHIMVNVPEFMYRVKDGEKTLLSERVVVGKLKNQTPVFSNKMSHMVFHPYWNVPNSIKVHELLPHLRNGGGGGGWFWGGGSSRPRILQAHGLFVKYKGRDIDASKVNWNKVNVANYRFYQPPGATNVLGFVKFMFPNKHAVYMHDTTSKSLFDQTQRAYSHGCVRVRNPRKLAELLLRQDRGWSSGNVGAAIASGKNQHVNLKNPIPVHIAYFTVRVNKNGNLTYFSDLYGHDSRMISKLKL